MDYLIVDYSLVTKEDEGRNDFSKRKFYVLTEDELFKLIDKSKGDCPEIVVFKIGDCVIDWS